MSHSQAINLLLNEINHDQEQLVFTNDHGQQKLDELIEVYLRKPLLELPWTLLESG